MSLLPALTLIRLHALAHLPLSYYLLTSPSQITDHNLIFMLGEAMSLPQPPTKVFTTPTPATALVALMLVLIALTDLSAGWGAKGEEEDEAAHFYWRTNVPVRLLFFFAVTGGSYLGAEGAVGMLGGGKRVVGGGGVVAGVGGWREACCNSLVFTWGFLEMVFWFWMFVTLREEGKARAGREAVRRKEEERRKEGL